MAIIKNIHSLAFISLFSIFFNMESCNTFEKKAGNSIQEIAVEMKIEKIEIRYVDMFITTFSRVGCSEFDNKFPKISLKKRLESKKDILEFENMLNKALSKGAKIKNIDTRVKAKLFYTTGDVKQVCFGLNGLDLDGTKYSIDKTFTDYLLNLTETD